jgi:hypothetical protein
MIFLTPTVETYEVVGTHRDWGSEFFVTYHAGVCDY